MQTTTAANTTNHTRRRRPTLRRATSRDGARAHLPITGVDQGSGAVDAARLQERARIARELHDSVAQTLYGISLAASCALACLERAPASSVEPSLHEVLALANTGQSELRALLTNIRFDLLPSGGLTAGLTNLAETVRRHQSCLDIHLSLDDDPGLPANTREELVLIAREALRNVERHSAANRVDITLVANPHEMVLQITDDGRGFDTTSTRPGHFGLRSMHERAASFGGRLEFISAAGGGTQVVVRVPRG